MPGRSRFVMKKFHDAVVDINDRKTIHQARTCDWSNFRCEYFDMFCGSHICMKNAGLHSLCCWWGFDFHQLCGKLTHTIHTVEAYTCIFIWAYTCIFIWAAAQRNDLHWIYLAFNAVFLTAFAGQNFFPCALRSAAYCTLWSSHYLQGVPPLRTHTAQSQLADLIFVWDKEA